MISLTGEKEEISFISSGRVTVKYNYVDISLTTGLTVGARTDSLYGAGSQSLVVGASGIRRDVQSITYASEDGYPVAITFYKDVSAIYEAELASGVVTGTGGQTAAEITANTAQIQAMLDVGGELIFSGAQVVVNKRLVIGARTTVKNLNIKQAAGTNTNMLVNAAYLAAPTNITLAWTAGRKATVTMAGHGLKVGETVSIYDVSPSQFIGVFNIHTVTDANTFIVALERLPAAVPTALNGSVKLKVADEEITLENCTFDYNLAENAAPPTGMDSHAVVIGHFHNLKVDCISNNALKYAFNIGAGLGYDVNVRSYGTGSDLLKIYGPAFHGKAYVSGRCGDDGISVQTREPNAFASYRWTYGDILGAELYADIVTNQSICAAYLSVNEYADDVKFNRVSGLCDGIAAKIVGDIDVANDTAGNFGRISFSNITATGLSNVNQPSSISSVNCTGQLVEIRQITAHRLTATDPVIRLSGTLKETVIDGAVESPSVTAGAYLCDAFQNGGTVVLRNVSLTKLVAFSSLHPTNTPKLIVLENSNIENSSRAGYLAPGVPRTNVVVRSCYLKVNHVLRNDNVLGMSVLIKDCVVEGAFEGLVRGSAAASPITLKAAGIIPLGATIVSVTRAVGSEVFTLDGSELRVDLSIIARVDGAILYNTNAALGTLGVAGLVVGQGTAANSWKLMSDPTKSY
jgi:hypothetical protein